MRKPTKPKSEKEKSQPGKRDEALEAAEIDAKLKELLLEAERRSSLPLATKESILEGEKFMKQARKNALVVLRERIKRKEFIAEEDFRQRLGVTTDWISTSIAANRLFYVLGPSGGKYFPAFYGDANYERRALEAVCKRLGNLPGPTKYHFFTSKSTYLGIKTPLAALADGKLESVLIAAAGFAER